MGREQRKMSLALGCAHQLPRIGAPAIASARLRTAPRPDSRTTPLALTKALACFGDILVLLPICRLMLAAHPRRHVTLDSRHFERERAAHGVTLGPTAATSVTS